MIEGIDVSSHQGIIDWDAVAQAEWCAFAITKATEGTGYRNPTFARNWSESKRVGIARGAYHWLSCNSTPESEARFFYDTVMSAGLEVGDVLAIDAEETPGSSVLPRYLLGFAQTLEKMIGYKPIIYTGPWIITGQGLTGQTLLGEYPLWLASYRANAPEPLTPWSLLSIWQNSSEWSVPGINGNVDHNYAFFDSVETFKTLGKPDVADAVPANGINPEKLATLYGVTFREDGVIIPALEHAMRQPSLNDTRHEIQAVVNFLRDNR